MKIGDELYPEEMPAVPFMTRSLGYYVSLYEFTFDNYLDNDGNCVVVGMTFEEVVDVFERVIHLVPPYGKGITVRIERDHVIFEAERVEYAQIYFATVEKAFQDRHCTITFQHLWYEGDIGGGSTGDGGGGSGGGGGGASGGDSGGGSGGGGGDSGSGFPEPPSVSTTPLVDLICDGRSTLTPQQKELLEKAINEFKDKCPEFAALFEILQEQTFIFSVDPAKTGVGGRACYQDGMICFADESAIDVMYLQEEFIHAFQAIALYGPDEMQQSYKNVEFEAKVFQDVLNSKNGWGEASRGSFGSEALFSSSYGEWILDGVDSNTSLIERFDDFCNQWKGYTGKYNPDFVPTLLINFLNL